DDVRERDRDERVAERARQLALVVLAADRAHAGDPGAVDRADEADHEHEADRERDLERRLLGEAEVGEAARELRRDPVRPGPQLALGKPSKLVVPIMVHKSAT